MHYKIWIKLLIHSRTSITAEVLLKYCHPTLYWACDYLSMLRLKLNHAKKRAPGGSTAIDQMTCLCRNWDPGPWFNIKMSSYQYRKSHCGDKTILQLSYLHNGISYTEKMTSLYWIEPLVPCTWNWRYTRPATFMRYRKTSNIRHTSPAGAAPTTSSFST